MSRAGCTLTGDWRKLNALMNKLSVTREYMESLIEAYAQMIRIEVINHINFGEFEPNTDTTLRRKGKGKRPLHETGVFGSDSGIIVDEVRMGGKQYFIIKGNPYLEHERTGVSYEQIASWMEFGNARVPARPVFHIVHDQMANDVPRYLISKLREEYRHF